MLRWLRQNSVPLLSFRASCVFLMGVDLLGFGVCGHFGFLGLGCLCFFLVVFFVLQAPQPVGKTEGQRWGSWGLGPFLIRVWASSGHLGNRGKGLGPLTAVF